MEFFNIMDPQLMLGIACIISALLGALLFYPLASKERHKMKRIAERTLKIQEDTQRQCHLMLQELKHANRALYVLADLEFEEAPEGQGTSEGITSQTKLYVGNIDYAATEAELASYFARFGKIEFVNIPVNRYNGRTRGFGFVTFTSIQDAERAMTLNGSEFKGRQIQVNFAKERD